MAKRVDKNQKEVVSALRSAGATVRTLHEIGKGCPDLLVGFRSKNYLFEIKDGTKEKLTDDQVEFFRTWGGQVSRVNSPEDAVAMLNLLSKQEQ